MVIKTRAILGLITLVLIFCTGCALIEPILALFLSPHIRLGNPSYAGSDPNNYLIVKPQYVLSYNRERATANWVAWQLNRDWLGNVERQNNFRADQSLPVDWYQVQPRDYTNSGYDRGHMTPSADRSASKVDNSATFLMTNIVPQTAANNRGSWRELEEYCRELVYKGRELYIFAGSYGEKEKFGTKKQIIAPTHTWKIVVVLEEMGLGVEGIDANTRVIAVDIPNRKNASADWRKYLVSVDDIERKTGYDFLNVVPESVQSVIESRVD